MIEQTLDLRRALGIVRRHIVAVVIITVVGLFAGAGYAVLRPPLLSSDVTIVLPPNARDSSTQALIAGSSNVLNAALRSISAPMSLQTLRARVSVKAVTSGALSLVAEGKTPAQAESIANAVAESYVRYVSSGVGSGTPVKPSIVSPASTAAGTSLWVRLLTGLLLGAVVGLLLASFGTLLVGRRDRRLRERDDIASATGIPVLASLHVWHPSDARAWARLLESYEPTVAQARRLSGALGRLGLTGAESSRRKRSSVTVLTLASDQRALAIGPQLAATAASIGLRTRLVVAAGRDAKIAAPLQAACAARSRSVSRPDRLQVAVADPIRPKWPLNAALTVVASVVDDNAPADATLVRTDAIILGLSAGSTTPDQLARVIAAISVDGRQVDAVILADPDPADHTTGRVPDLIRPRYRAQPTRVSGVPVRSRR